MPRALSRSQCCSRWRLSQWRRLRRRNQQPAVFLGQGNLTEGLPNFINRFGFDAPVSVAIDRSVYAQSPLRRRLEQQSSARISNLRLRQQRQRMPILLFGEHNPGAINDYLSGSTASTLFHPSGIAVDSNGNLFVADSGANRVLEYNVPFIIRTPAPLPMKYSAPAETSTAKAPDAPAAPARPP